MRPHLQFPPGFLWGTATSAYQVEGGNTNNSWTAFEAQPDTIAAGGRSGIACNWWQNAEADFDQMQKLGFNAHRLSIEWSRIEPQRGRIDQTALARYRQMLQALHARGIIPWVALHHFTNPEWLERAGGWEQPEVITHFARYAAIIVDALGDLCNTWLTFNEPLVYLGQGWLRGIWPPQHPNLLVALRVFRHLLEAHAAAYHTIKAINPTAQVAVAKAMRHFDPARPTHLGDRWAARLRRHLFEDLWFAATLQGKLLPPLGLGTSAPHLADTLDFIGINYYARYQVTFTPNPRAIFGREGYTLGSELADSSQHGPSSQFDPAGLAVICRRTAHFGKPLYITEHGVADQRDRLRPRWLVAHLALLHALLQEGLDIRGYFHWSLVDNFEWTDGWTMHFGLIALNQLTQQRTLRPSAHLYGEIARAGGLTQAQLARYSIGSSGER
jgi:beta-glucosidase